MLGNRDAIANLAVKDLNVAKKFYTQTLGLTPTDEMGQELVVFRSGKTNLNVYKSQYAGTNQATAVTWVVGPELESVIQALKAKGVAFEHYDLPDTERRGDIHVCGDIQIAWFKDPDGNILCLVSQ